MPEHTANRRVVLGVTALAAFMAFLDVTIVNIAFPSIIGAFPHVTLAGLSWVLNAYNLVLAAVFVPAGRLADLVGRRRVLQAGLALFTVSSAACAAAPTVGVLIAARCFEGIGAAMLVPASLGLLLQAFATDQRATAVGLWGAAAAVASVIGPSLGALLVHESGWRLVFLVNVPIGAITIALVRRQLSESRDEEHGGLPDPVGIALIAAGVGLLALGIVQGGQWGWATAAVRASLAGGVALTILFMIRSARHENPVIEVGLLRERAFACANAATFLFACAFYALLLCNILFLTQVWGYSLIQAGLALIPSTLMAALVAGPAGRIADRWGYRVVTTPGVLLYAAGVSLFLIRVGVHPAYFELWLPANATVGIGIGLAFPALGAAATSTVPPARYATGAAINSSIRLLGAVLGVAILIAILGIPSTAQALEIFDHGWTFIILMAVAAAPACLFLPSPKVQAQRSSEMRLTRPSLETQGRRRASARHRPQ
jgi:NTE family protein